MDVFDYSRRLPVEDILNLCRVHFNARSRDDHPQVRNFSSLEFVLLDIELKAYILEGFEDRTDVLTVVFEII